MWNIRSHACRFPVHTGTLTPSIAHPNRFLNHLKRFSAGFLTFKGGKSGNADTLGRELPQSAAQTAPSGMGPLASRESFRANLKVRRTGKDGYPLSHGLRRARFPLLSLRNIFPRSGGSLSSQGGAFGHLPVSANKAPPSGELAATSGSRLRGSAPSPRELAKPSGFD